MTVRSRLGRANGLLPFHLFAALGIGLALAAIVLAQTWSIGWRDPRQLGLLAALYGGSGFVGTFAGSWLAALFALRGGRAMALWSVMVTVGAMGLGAFVFAFSYRMAHVQWHEATFSIAWAFQGVFTMIGAAYFWAVLGTRMVLPFALVPLIVGGFLYARLSSAQPSR